MNYRVLAALQQDMNQGWIWLSQPSLGHRSIVKVVNLSNGKIVFCEALQIDENFLADYNQPPRLSITGPESSLVMNAWYRKLLGDLVTNHDHDLKIGRANNPYGKLRACLQHPQVVVRLATWLALLSVFLGALGVFLGFR